VYERGKWLSVEMERRWKMRVLSQKFKNGEEKGAQYLEKFFLPFFKVLFAISLSDFWTKL
jgi:hypothetical protein